MVFKHIRTEYAARVVMLTLTAAAAVLVALETPFPYTAALLAAAAVLQGWLLIRSVERHAGEVGRFFDSIRCGDLAGTFTSPGGRVFDDLYDAMNEAIERFRTSKAECEDRYLTFRTVVEHAGIGIILFRPGGEVVISNTAARRLLRIPRLAHLGELPASCEGAAKTMQKLRPGERAVVQSGEDPEAAQLAIQSADITLAGEHLHLVSLNDIRYELEDKEAEAWQNLIRVLTHEIMNSITPIVSLASTARSLIEGNSGATNPDDRETEEDIRGAVRTIEDRGRGLLRFVESYRTLTRIPEPVFRVVPVRELFDRLSRLFRDRFEASGIRIDILIVPESLELTVDPELVEQMLINIVQNALQALNGRENGVICLSAGLDELSRPFIRVSDNGPGIEKDVMEKIFIPFFTTRHEGSGIGLSLSRRIARLHGGTITAASKQDEETVFTVHLPM